ncbi:hypothetical protein SCUCBS95973_005494 [Sporothrix curviconia]|uniref:Uncharacterized protein n=1 Tax=Sporothrix curviconia TaxID=1260050 RepID=A0ABP0BY30_9PEZI
MGAALSVIKTLFLPAFAALAVFILFTFIIVPVWQHYRNRYSHYLPIDTLSNQTLSLRDRMQSSLSHFFSRAATTTSWRDRVAANGGDTGIGGRIRSLFRRGGGGGGGDGGELGLNDNDLLSDDEDLALNLHDPTRGLSLGEVGEELGTMRPERRNELPRGGAVHDQRRLSRE